LLYLLGMTKDMVTSPAASFDRASVPDMSMRTGDLRICNQGQAIRQAVNNRNRMYY
jgi:hypothetical protein